MYLAQVGVELGAFNAPLVLEWCTDGTASRLQHFVWCQPPASVAMRFHMAHSQGHWNWGRGWGADRWNSSWGSRDRAWRGEPDAP